VQFNRERRNRRSIRLREYDYTQVGAYFVTICTHGRECLFGEIVDAKMRLNDAGRMVQSVWEGLPRHYAGMDIDEFVVMPNHVHGILTLLDGGGIVGSGFKPALTVKRYGLPEIVRGFKTFSSRQINQSHGTTGTSLWQRNYYEHIVRDENDLNRIRRYIEDNLLMWAMDRENPRGQPATVSESGQV
jgi:putative transposase